MKKVVLFFIVTFMGLLTVKAYTEADLGKVVATGDVTKAFVEQLKSEGCDTVSIDAVSMLDTLSIPYDIKCEVEKERIINGEKKKVKEVTNGSGTITFVKNGEILESKKDRTDEENDKDPYYARILQLTPYWGAEMSSRYPQIKKYLDANHKKDYLGGFALIFDSCYFQEMGVCYSATPSLGKTTFTGRVQMDDKAADYALKYLKKEQREINTKQWMLRGIIVAAVLGVIILICKSMSPEKAKRPLKY